MKLTNQQLIRTETERNRIEMKEQNRGYRPEFENKVLEYDAHIEEDIKVVEKKVDKILEQLSQGEENKDDRHQ